MSECKGQKTNNERQHCAQKNSINNTTTFQNRWKTQVLRWVGSSVMVLLREQA